MRHGFKQEFARLTIDHHACPRNPIGTDPVTGLIEIERFGKLERDLIPRLELLDRVRKRHERMGRELEMNVVLIAEMLDPMHLGDVVPDDPLERS